MVYVTCVTLRIRFAWRSVRTCYRMTMGRHDCKTRDCPIAEGYGKIQLFNCCSHPGKLSRRKRELRSARPNPEFLHSRLRGLRRSIGVDWVRAAKFKQGRVSEQNSTFDMIEAGTVQQGKHWLSWVRGVAPVWLARPVRLYEDGPRDLCKPNLTKKRALACLKRTMRGAISFPTRWNRFPRLLFTTIW